MFQSGLFANVVRRRSLGPLVVMAAALLLTLPAVASALIAGEQYADTSFTLGEVVNEIGANNLYAQGYTGQGVDVAVIDTGVSPVLGLNGASKLVVGPDLSFEAGVPELYGRDTHGHGTVMASIIAGNDEVVDGYRGVAPGARIVSLKVADNTGAVDVSQVIAALDWVVANGHLNGLNIRVINLSYNTDSDQPADSNPLVYAVERAWQAGYVVVVSAGNDGNQAQTLGNPAISPYVISVASSGQAGTGLVSSTFTSAGDSRRAPDLTAPGERILGLAAPDSRLVQEHPGAFIGGRFLRGSGTSQAAAVTSGAAALLFEARPGLTPDQLKALLMLGTDITRGSTSFINRWEQTDQIQDRWSGTKFGNVNLDRTIGVGWLNVGRSSTLETLDVTQQHQGSDGSGSLEGARGHSHVTLPDGSLLTGEVTFTGSIWAPSSSSGGSQGGGSSPGGSSPGGSSPGGPSGSTWSGSTWSGSTWSGSSWSGSSWSGSSWSGSSWSGSSWSGSSWSGSSWSGSSWSGSSWSGSSWSGSSWSGSSWSGSTWS